MRIIMRSASTGEHLSTRNWDIALVGQQVDDRGRAARLFVRGRSAATMEMVYDSDALTVRLDGLLVTADRLEEYLRPLAGKRLILESTTLGLPEVLLSLRSLRSLGVQSVSLIYVEPARYSAPQDDRVLERRAFELSEEMGQFKGIPGTTFILNDTVPQKIVFFLGYEGQRLTRAVEQFGIRGSRTSVVFGVPAFNPGWEMDAFHNNVKTLSERQITGGVFFCGAENPLGAVEILEAIFAEDPISARLFVGPIGTKPHGLGAALFACTHDGIGVLYDHPKRKEKRTDGVGTWHLFEVAFP